MILPPTFTKNVGDYSCAGPHIFAPYIAPKLSRSFQWQYVCIPSRDGITFCHLRQGKISGGNTHICKQSAYLINFRSMCAIFAMLWQELQRWQIIDVCRITDYVIHYIDIFIIIWYLMPSYFAFPPLTFLNIFFSIYITFQCYENGEVSHVIATSGWVKNANRFNKTLQRSGNHEVVYTGAMPVVRLVRIYIILPLCTSHVPDANKRIYFQEVIEVFWVGIFSRKVSVKIASNHKFIVSTYVNAHF